MSRTEGEGRQFTAWKQTGWNRTWYSLSYRFQPVPVLMPNFEREAVIRYMSSKGFAGGAKDQSRVAPNPIAPTCNANFLDGVFMFILQPNLFSVSDYNGPL